ncbi:MAG: superoxide dismutase family protein [Candidatus Sericytochromatia bacterium]|nr:superoxide dismutase family protein [Candidatus Sericytochromatia bacterium]
MKSGLLVTAGLVLCGGLAWAASAKAPVPGYPTMAKAELRNTKGEVIGDARFVEGPAGVLISIKAKGLPPGSHGIHIHETGACDAPKFTSAGGHFHPEKHDHGFMHATGAHSGDLTNLVVAADGTVETELLAPKVTLQSGTASLLKPRGTALIIHAKADDYKSQPAGDAGDRIACGMITVVK